MIGLVAAQALNPAMSGGGGSSIVLDGGIIFLIIMSLFNIWQIILNRRGRRELKDILQEFIADGTLPSAGDRGEAKEQKNGKPGFAPECGRRGEKIVKLQTRQDRLIEDVCRLTSDVGEIKEDVGEIKGRVKGIESGIERIEDKIDR